MSPVTSAPATNRAIESRAEAASAGHATGYTTGAPDVHPPIMK